MAKKERTIWEMMGVEPPAAYREAPPPRGGRGAVQSVRFTVRRAAVRTDGFIGPEDLEEVSAPDMAEWGAVEEVSADVAATEPPPWSAPIQPVNVPDARPTDPLRIGGGDDSMVRRLMDLLPRILGGRSSDGADSAEA